MDVTVRLNPFGATAGNGSMESLLFDGEHLSKHSANDVLQNATRLDVQTCKKQGIYFDDVEQAEEADEKSEHSDDIEADETDSVKLNGDLSTTEENVSEKGERSLKGQPAVEGVADIEEQKLNEKIKKKKRAETKRIVLNILLDLIKNVVQEEPEPVVLQGSFLESESTSTENISEDVNINNSQSNEITSGEGICVNENREVHGNSIQHKQVNLKSRDNEPDLDNISLYAGRAPEASPVACNVHPLHTHLLLYTQKYDTERTLYALSVIKAILSNAPRLVICALSTTNISAVSTPHLLHFQDLLLRHRRSVFGKNFFSEISYDSISLNK